MPEPVNLGYALRLPPEEVIEYFKSKGFEVSWNWFDVLKDQHTRAFTVAKATQAQVLQTIYGEVRDALQEGITEREFIRRMTPKLKALGWWGRQEVVNEVGAIIDVQLGSPHRLKTIFRTNMRTALNSGRYKQQVRMAEHRPYWQYVTIQDERVRASHAALHGKVFRWDDPVWEYIYPPNGFGCRCRVRALSQFRLEREGLSVDSSAGKLHRITTEIGVDAQTGEVVYQDAVVFRGQDIIGRDITFQPDPGWDYNPGATVLWDKLGGLDDVVSDSLDRKNTGKFLKAVPAQRTWQDHDLPDLRDLPDNVFIDAPDNLETPDNSQQALDLFAMALGITDKTPVVSVTTPAGVVQFDRERLAHLALPDRLERARFANYLLPALQQPAEIWQVEYQDGVPRQRYISLFREPGSKRATMIVTRFNADGSIFWTFYRSRLQKLNRERVGVLIG
ncbi:MAG: minor capsid protein [Gammaproteobacteria bacterium]|nr:minor capsid protein [Gammaproteobacteria bacterium]